MLIDCFWEAEWFWIDGQCVVSSRSLGNCFGDYEIAFALEKNNDVNTFLFLLNLVGMKFMSNK